MWIIFRVLALIVIFTKLVVTSGNYFGMVNNEMFNELVCSNFLELCGRNC